MYFFLIPGLFCTQFFRASLVQTAVSVIYFFRVSRYIQSGQAQNVTLLFSLIPVCGFNIIIFQETCHALVCAMFTSKTNQFALEKSRKASAQNMLQHNPSSCQFTGTTIKCVFFAYI